jgi:hypothetical protein
MAIAVPSSQKKEQAMAQHRNFEIETTIVPDAAGQYEATFVIQDAQAEKSEASGRGRRYAFPAVGSYLTPDDAREQTEAWARKWIDANFPG